jgi:hypothetical protein
MVDMMTAPDARVAEGGRGWKAGGGGGGGGGGGPGAVVVAAPLVAVRASASVAGSLSLGWAEGSAWVDEEARPRVKKGA